jgi:hypothetical protein
LQRHDRVQAKNPPQARHSKVENNNYTFLETPKQKKRRLIYSYSYPPPINRPGSEVGLGAVATWGKSTADQAYAMGFRWERKGQSSKHIHLNGAASEREHFSLLLENLVCHSLFNFFSFFLFLIIVYHAV